ncbi:hypothetical protein TRIUR3_11354 [Triticum urartu]|uniref:Uncharacterized protein n=1 Tax=Triticum urartu TaxID=4572 RepID=M8A0D8_TRIUA|nr:hypothetical protein TRIUR3_11354 [Triticum urartu]
MELLPRRPSPVLLPPRGRVPPVPNTVQFPTLLLPHMKELNFMCPRRWPSLTRSNTLGLEFFLSSSTLFKFKIIG